MNPHFTKSLVSIAPALFLGACVSGPARTTVTNPNHPGPGVGQTLGAGVGAVAGNVAGAAVGFVEGAAGAAKAPFDNTRRVVRHWRTETTPDGRLVQVPEDIEVDAYGRALKLK